ncbi:hypothetical protein HMPREF1621_03355 [Escherichia coli A25922R]|nr:hypothetical protein HMPREF1621_03355 [Escherichia coli A25922R]
MRLNPDIITFSGFKSGTCHSYSGRVTDTKKVALERLDLHTVWCEGRTQTCDLTS